MKSKLYIEFRLRFNPEANQDALSEMAEAFQEHIYDLWNNDVEHGASLDVTDVTYELTREYVLDKDVCKCVGETTMIMGECICSKCGKVQVN